MSFRKIHLLTLSVLLLSVLTGMALARGSIRVSSEYAAQPAPQYVQITDENLAAWLRDAGQPVKEEVSSQGVRSWVIQVKQDGKSYPIQVYTYRNKAGSITGFWLIGRLGQPLANAGAATGQFWYGLLEKNHTIVPHFFSLDRATGFVCLNYEHPYSTTNKEQVGTIVNNFIAKVSQTESVWTPIPPLKDGIRPEPVKTVSLPGTTWAGSETLSGFGKLSFRFEANGQATMIDTSGSYPGTWTQQDSAVTLSFFNGDVIYRGQLMGVQFSGTATNKAAASWTFQLSLQQ